MSRAHDGARADHRAESAGARVGACALGRRAAALRPRRRSRRRARRRVRVHGAARCAVRPPMQARRPSAALRVRRGKREPTMARARAASFVPVAPTTSASIAATAHVATSATSPTTAPAPTVAPYATTANLATANGTTANATTVNVATGGETGRRARFRRRCPILRLASSLSSARDADDRCISRFLAGSSACRRRSDVALPTAISRPRRRLRPRPLHAGPVASLRAPTPTPIVHPRNFASPRNAAATTAYTVASGPMVNARDACAAGAAHRRRERLRAWRRRRRRCRRRCRR